MNETVNPQTVSRAEVRAWASSNLKPGVDFITVHRKNCSSDRDKATTPCPRCGAKACLTKSGSEAVNDHLHLRPTFRRDTDVWEMLGKPDGDKAVVCLICEAVAADGSIVGEGRGARLLADDGGDANKSIKMAAKSAQVDAAIRIGGLSDMFTLDLDTVSPRTAAATGLAQAEPPIHHGQDVTAPPWTQPDPAAVEQSAPECPKCGKAMRVKTRKSDNSPFWACPGYPTCRATMPFREVTPPEPAPPPSSDDPAVRSIVDDAMSALRVVGAARCAPNMPDGGWTMETALRLSKLARCASHAIRTGLAPQRWETMVLGEWVIRGSKRAMGDLTDNELVKNIEWLEPKPDAEREADFQP